MEPAQIPNQAVPRQEVLVPANEVKINSTEMLHELMTRNGYYLPSIKSR